jgi:rubrerythrin
MFTLSDIRDIAIQIERNGEETYQRASEAVVDSKIAVILRWLAQEERRHAEFFASLAPTEPLSAEQSEAEAMGRSLLQSMVRDKTFSLDQQSLNSVESLAEMFSQARGFEQDTVLFYEFLKDIVDDHEVKQQLDIIIREENRHVVILGRLAANELVDDLLASSGHK